MAKVIVENVSVSFPIFEAGKRSLKNAMMAASTGGRIGNDGAAYVVQALDHVSFVLERGDRVALIGHNGAGKTTLLRVLAGIFEPTTGSVQVEGKVTPMFDLSLGTDLESTGYENILLRGLYMGLSRAEIAARANEVAEFTELGEFLNLPVRTYSAGMQARLAFAMATCIDPEILLLDEGIGAGDANFLEKANARLERFIARTGILVLASHSPDLIRRLCNKAILMEHGQALGVRGLEDALAAHQLHSAGLPP